jgi:hypothetical protein
MYNLFGFRSVTREQAILCSIAGKWPATCATDRIVSSSLALEEDNFHAYNLPVYSQHWLAFYLRYLGPSEVSSERFVRRRRTEQ